MKTLGKYEVLEELGAGAMGKVFHGRDRVLQREVAIKTISTEDADVELKQRFYREARACGRLSHPNIVTVFDLGEQQGTSYIAMEYLDGEDLRKFIDRKTFMPLEGKLQVMGEVVDGLAHAHDNRIVHRDIKPSNILLLKSGRPKILDFGIARVFASQLTRVGNALGTPEYMAPEQIRGKETDARSDIFSAAVVFFELLTNEHPFGDTDVPRRIIQECPKSLRSLNPLIPEKLDQILNRAMAKDPAERYQTAAEFAKALRKLSFEVMGQCSLLVEEALQSRQHVLDSLAVISKGDEMPWIQKRLRDERVDVGIVGKINPETALTTNPNIHFFTLSALAKDLARAADVLAEIAAVHERVINDINQARKLLAEGNGDEALRVIKANEERKSDYREIETLKVEIEKQIADKAEAEQQAVPSFPATVVISAPKENQAAPEVQAVRERIAALLEQDIDKCLAEIEILSPALANDSTIDSYWVRALSMRSAQQAASAAAKVQTPVPRHEEAQTKTSIPPARPAPQRELPTVLASSPNNMMPEAETTPPESEPLWRRQYAKLAAGIAAAVVLLIVAVYAFRDNTVNPEPSIESRVVRESPQAALETPAPGASPTPPMPEQFPEKRGGEGGAKSGSGGSTPRPPRPLVQVDWSKDLAAASQAFAAENYDGALAICDKILRAQPANKEAADLKQRVLGAKALVEKLNSKRN